MDFNDTPEESEFRTQARGWLDSKAERLPADERALSVQDVRNDPDAMPKAQAWQAVKADGGWACITWPTEYGGRDATRIQNTIWGQEESRYRVPPNMFTIGQGMLGPTLMAHGTEEQKAQHLEPMLRGDKIWCQLFSEPCAGSDLAGLRTAAAQDGDEWVIDGQKIWTSGAQYSDWGMIVTRTNPSAVKHAGITYFIVDMNSPGIEIRPIVQMNGYSGFNEVFFTGVRVPDSNRVGAVNDGWRGAITTLMNERAAIGGGNAGPGFDQLLELAHRVGVGNDPSVRQRLADFYVRQKGLQYTGYRTLTALSRGQTPGPQSSLGKLVGAALRQHMAGFAVDLMGEAGAMSDPEISPDEAAWQESLLSSPGARLAGGTDEILRNIISERVLGLPPDVRLDKDLAFQDVPTGPPSR
jgi:alkylation response protein AidB-like acyl-CoA dehydrogenase